MFKISCERWIRNDINMKIIKNKENNREIWLICVI